VDLDFERCYRAVDSRDRRFDGWFYTGVTSTGIYCRPSCPAITPKRENVRFYPSAAAAQRAGLRACRRCRPDAAPGSPHWDVRADVVGRAMRLIGDGVVDREGVPGLAARLGYTERHLHRILAAQVGAGPLALARAQRAQTARVLVETTDLGLAEIAFAAGFGSVRQFNDTIRDVYAATPSDLRASVRHRAGGVGAGTIRLRLAYRPPLHADALLDFFAPRAIPGIEEVRDGSYHRGLRLPHGTAEVTLTPLPEHVAATLRLSDVRDLAPAVARCRRLLDLDADPDAVDATLAGEPALAVTVAKEPGVRVPRAVDGFEMAVRAIVGQQVSVAGARTVLARLVAAAGGIHPTGPADVRHRTRRDIRSRGDKPDQPEGEQDEVDAGGTVNPDRDGSAGPGDTAGRDGNSGGPGTLQGFPSAAEVLMLPDQAFGMPAARRQTIRTLARAVAEGTLDLDPGADRAELADRLTGLPGIGPWTAGYVAMRGLGDPDIFLPTDLAVRRGAAALGLSPDPKILAQYATRWRPWRAYAMIRLWRSA
jgi:AraC family transcriptional regulator of adaptative response / DNA-3-methyladenine glycosylase II